LGRVTCDAALFFWSKFDRALLDELYLAAHAAVAAWRELVQEVRDADPIALPALLRPAAQIAFVGKIRKSEILAILAPLGSSDPGAALRANSRRAGKSVIGMTVGTETYSKYRQREPGSR
jgi:hypothetical protein